MNTGEPIKIIWEEPQPGTWRLIVWRWDENDQLEHGGYWSIHDIIESTDRNYLIRQLIDRASPFAEDLQRSAFTWRKA